MKEMHARCVRIFRDKKNFHVYRLAAVLVATVGGYVCHDTFDHTSVTRLLELVTGVRNPNITAWRRKTAGDFTAALGTP
jgi:hypothetical protein